jgi:hypothetical protein
MNKTSFIRKIILSSLTTFVFFGCSSKEEIAYMTPQDTLKDPKKMWIYNPEADKDDDETCVVSSKKNYNDPNDIGVLISIAQADLIGKFINKVNNSKEITTTRGGSDKRTIKEYGDYRSLTAEDVEISQLKSYVKNIDTYNDKIVIRLCSKGLVQNSKDKESIQTDIVDIGLIDFAKKDRK